MSHQATVARAITMMTTLWYSLHQHAQLTQVSIPTTRINNWRLFSMKIVKTRLAARWLSTLQWFPKFADPITIEAMIHIWWSSSCKRHAEVTPYHSLSWGVSRYPKMLCLSLSFHAILLLDLLSSSLSSSLKCSNTKLSMRSTKSLCLLMHSQFNSQTYLILRTC